MGRVGNPAAARKVPVIDFSSETMKPGSTRWESTAKEVCKALEVYGCFLAVFDVPSCNPFFESLKGLFDLPVETKTTNNSDVPYFGYIGEQPRCPLFESFGINDGTNFTQVSNFSNRMWPAGGKNDHYRDLILSYATEVSELDKMITRMLFESYGVKDNSWDEHIKSTIYNLRMNKYRAPKPEETKVGLVSHTDMSFMGINQQSQIGGLEVCFKDGTWVPVDFPPNSFIILAGDAMMAWSNGKIRHCLHRVTMTGEERYSSGLFSHHTGITKVPHVFINESNPRKFKDFDHLGLLNFRFTHPDIPEEQRIVAYCGVN